MSSDPREARLPRWAREVLSAERRRADVAETRLAEHLETVQTTRIWYGEYTNKIYIPEPFGHQTVHLNPYGDGKFHNDIQVRIKDRSVEVNGGDSLSVDMYASNLFYVRTRR